MAKAYEPISDEKAREVLTSLQYKVIKQEGTEHAFDNIYWNFKGEGIYVDHLSGEPPYFHPWINMIQVLDGRVLPNLLIHHT